MHRPSVTTSTDSIDALCLGHEIRCCCKIGVVGSPAWNNQVHGHLLRSAVPSKTRWYRQVPDWQARSWRVDETYIRVGGKWCYLYRAITAGGQTLDFYLSPKRNVAAAKRFLAKTLRSNTSAGFPRVINTDKAPSLSKAIIELKEEGICPQTVEHRQVKYLNNVLEGDHGRLKRILGPKGAFKNRTSAYRTLKGMEAMHSLRKGQGTMFAYGQPNPDAAIVSRAFETA